MLTVWLKRVEERNNYLQNVIILNKMTQYQKELKAVIESGGDIEKFKEDWHKRACQEYRRNVKTTSDINKFRSGRFKI